MKMGAVPVPLRARYAAAKDHGYTDDITANAFAAGAIWGGHYVQEGRVSFDPNDSEVIDRVARVLRPWFDEDTPRVQDSVRRFTASNIIVNNGDDASQTVYHAHVHVVPRIEDDGLKLPWSQ